MAEKYPEIDGFPGTGAGPQRQNGEGSSRVLYAESRDGNSQKTMGKIIALLEGIRPGNALSRDPSKVKLSSNVLV